MNIKKMMAIKLSALGVLDIFKAHLFKGLLILN